ncbi:MAG: hypothetical protein ACPGU1_20895, partial [Myxococcota bacterium]
MNNQQCDDELNCDAFGFDNGACEPNGPKCGNQLCEPGEDNINCPQDCDGAPQCPDGGEKDCDGVCHPIDIIDALMNNQQCDDELNCDAFGFDNGACDGAPQCPDGGEKDCNGVCHPIDIIDALMNNQQCDDELNCDAFGFDNGACAPPEPFCGDNQCNGDEQPWTCINDCPAKPGEVCEDPSDYGAEEPLPVFDCDGVCFSGYNIDALLQNNACDGVLNCDAFGFDNGACEPGPECGDNICEPGEDEENCPGDCAQAPCQDNEIADCDGVCQDAGMVADFLGNTICDPFLNCDDFQADNGDCATSSDCGDGICSDNEDHLNCAQDCIDDTACPPGQMMACDNMTCVDEALGMNGKCDEPLNCVEFNFDGGDCSIQCADEELVSCDGTECVPANWMADEECDPELNCENNQFDAGDCAPPLECPPGELLSCDKQDCITDAAKGDGFCDLALDCEIYEADGGDCLDQGPCESGEILACDGETCVEASLEGNGVCNTALQCDQTNWDGGDCCQPPEIKGCNEACADPGWQGDGLCDYVFNCADQGFDGGDCDDTANMMLVVNEIDADQPGDDTREFVELLNIGSGKLLLDEGWRIEVINGANGLVKETWTFGNSPVLNSGMMALIGNKLVVGNAPDMVETIEAPNGFVENDHESIAIYRWDGPSESWFLVDAVAWGDLPSSGPGEGSQAPADTPSGDVSIGRCPDGQDTNNNAVDFKQMTPSPGLQNICEGDVNPPIEGPDDGGPDDPGGPGNPGDGPGGLPQDP